MLCLDHVIARSAIREVTGITGKTGSTDDSSEDGNRATPTAPAEYQTLERFRAKTTIASPSIVDRRTC